MIKRHYEKVIAGCCFLFLFVNIGMGSTAFAVHQPYLVAIEGIGDTGGSLILSMRTLVSLLAMLVVDRYYQLLDVRIGVFVACLCTGGGFFLYSVAGSLPAFLVGAFVLGAGYGLGGLVAMTYLTNRWFARGIGGVVGFATMGSGFAGIIMPLVVVQIIERFGLSAAFRVESAVAVFVGVVVFVLLRNRPDDLGMQPYEGKPGKRKARTAPELLPAPTHARIVLLMAVTGVGIFSCGAITYLSVLMTSSGFDPVFAATLVSLTGVCLTASKFITGKMFDRWGTERSSAVMFALVIAGLVLSCFAGLANAGLMVCGVVMFGTGLSLGSVGVSVWSLELSTSEDRARQVKNFQVGYALGGFIANTFPGIVKDLVGTYVVSYAAMALIAAFAAAIILRFYRTYTRRTAS